MGGIILLVFIFGLFLGSFYNVVGLRTLKNESIAFPPSHCTICKHKLGVMDLVPVISWLSLGGKCRYCKSPISAIYPFGELFTALGYAVVVWRFGLTLYAIPHLVLITVLAMATASDLKEMEVPDRFVVVGLIVNIILRIIIQDGLIYYVASGIACFVILYLVMILSKGGMGGADVKMYALIGLTMGMFDGLATLFYAAILGVIYNLPKLLSKKVGRKTELPMIPLISLGVVIVYIFNIYEYLM